MIWTRARDNGSDRGVVAWCATRLNPTRRGRGLIAAYLRATGEPPGLVATTAVGLHTIEQLWFIATGDTNPVVRRTSELLDAPRRAWSRMRALA